MCEVDHVYPRRVGRRAVWRQVMPTLTWRFFVGLIFWQLQHKLQQICSNCTDSAYWLRMDTVIKQVMGLPQLAPSPEVNQAFSKFVEAVIMHPQWHVDDAALLHDLQCRCSEAEGKLERFWAQKIIRADNSLKAVKEFPYQDNYRALTSREIQLIERSGVYLGKQSRVAIIGSGSLPLTAWWLYWITGAKITHIDSCKAAVDLAKQLAQALRWPCSFVCGDGRSVDLPVNFYDVVYIAGLAGQSVADKQRIVDHILPSLTPNGRVVVRSARGSRELLYPAFAASEITHVVLQEEYHPTDEVINSVFVYRKECDEG